MGSLCIEQIRTRSLICIKRIMNRSLCSVRKSLSEAFIHKGNNYRSVRNRNYTQPKHWKTIKTMKIIETPCFGANPLSPTRGCSPPLTLGWLTVQLCISSLVWSFWLLLLAYYGNREETNEQLVVSATHPSTNFRILLAPPDRLNFGLYFLEPLTCWLYERDCQV